GLEQPAAELADVLYQSHPPVVRCGGCRPLQQRHHASPMSKKGRGSGKSAGVTLALRRVCLLEPPVLLLQRTQPLLNRGRGRGELRRRDGLRLRSDNSVGLLLIQLAGFLLEQAQRLSKRLGGVGELLRAEEQNQNQEDQNPFHGT